MTKKEAQVVKEILDLINRIKDKTDDISLEERIPSLELEVIVSKIEQLHQKAIVLKYLNDHKEEMEQEGLVQEIEETKEVEEEKVPIAIKADETDPLSIEQIKADIQSLNIDAVSYNDIAEGETDGSIAEKLQKQPLADIKAAIGINEKFQYINDVFGGDGKAYENAIEKINAAANLDEALQQLSEADIDTENSSLQSLIELINRKFG